VSRALSSWQALVLGLVVCVGVGLGAVGLFVVGGRGWYGPAAFHVKAAFHDVKGVGKGTRVRIKGMDVGEVVDVLPPESPDEPVVLRLVIKGEYRGLIRSDSVVHIESDGLVGGKLLNIQAPPRKPGEPAPPASNPVEEDQPLAGDSSDLMDQVATALGSVQDGKGSLGKFVTDDTAHAAFVDLMQQGSRTLKKSEQAADALQQDAEAVKKLPLVGGYVEDPSALLERYNSQRDRRFFAVADLFEPGRAVLTSQGRKRLDDIAPWLEGMKHPGSDVVVVAYADPETPNPQSARTLTRQQSETVCEYLKKQHNIQKMGWFSSRRVTALGQGVNPPPMAETEALPADRVEVQVYTP
jgi:phospholipid/cholesterol/gamma-HCH transport system substrate-binding protein